jgi:hypothetical protein
LFARQLRRLVDYYCITEVFDYPLGDVEADFLMGLLASPVKQGDFDLVAGFDEFRYLAHLDIEIMLPDLKPEPDLFHIERFSGLTVLLQLLGALVIELAPIDDFANRRIGVRRNLYQIQTLLLGDAERLLLAEDAKLLAVFIDDTKLGCPNLVIQAGVFGDISVSLVVDFKVQAF